MIPDPTAVSAFAVYSGLIGSEKNKKKRIKRKLKLGSVIKPKSIKIDKKKLKLTLQAQIPKRNKNKTIKEEAKLLLSKVIDTKNCSEVIENEESNEFIPEEVSNNENHENSEMLKGKRRFSENKKNKRIKVKRKNNAVNESVQPELREGAPLATKNTKKKRKNDVVNESAQSELSESDPSTTTNIKENINMDTLNESTQSELSESDQTTKKIKGKKKKNVKLLKDKKFSEQSICSAPKVGSVSMGRKTLERIISPYTTDIFFREYWEKNPLHINRGGKEDYYINILSSKEIDDMLRFNVLMFNMNVDVTSYDKGVRETHNPEGRAHPHVVWDYYSNGCSIRILNPQTYLPKVHTLLAYLQEYFGCFVGANVYMTPPNSQGFAPHFDDIEAFVLQIEGSKQWKVYKPRNEMENLARYSSPNFTDDDIGEPMMEVLLKPGDLLYFPRGYIHQAHTVPGQHSLHITISAYQNTSWYHLMKKALPLALESAVQSCVELRKGLPLGYSRYTGFGVKGKGKQTEYVAKARKLMSLVLKHLDVEQAVDEMAVNTLHEALPPVLSKNEMECSVYGGLMMGRNGKLSDKKDLELTTAIRWIRAQACRLVKQQVVDEEGIVSQQIRLYHSCDNSKVYRDKDPQFLEIPPHLVPAVIHLTNSYPDYVQIKYLPLPSDEEKLVLVGDLWDRGLILTEFPLKSSSRPNE